VTSITALLPRGTGPTNLGSPHCLAFDREAVGFDPLRSAAIDGNLALPS
jgi:hypothetical protein